MEKQAFRKKYKDLREKLNPSQLEEFSLQIANNALELPIWNATYYHLFLPIKPRFEVNTEYLLHILQGKDKSIVLSKANFETSSLKHILLQENTPIKISTYGIPEPASGIEISVDVLDVVFVPLLAFDVKGNRVGYGKGFYDRFLSKCSDKAVFVGLSLFPPVEKISTTEFDIPLHFCITPQNIHSF